MASVRNLVLDPINVVVANANAHVTYEIVFDSYDINSNQPYIMECKLVGDDTGEAGLGGDDDIVDGRLTGLVGEIVQSDGESAKQFEFDKRLPKANLDEDSGLVGNERDEIQAEVTLTPFGPRASSLQSLKQTLVA